MVTSPEEAYQSNREGSKKGYKESQRFQEPSVRRATPKATYTNVSIQETKDGHGRAVQASPCVRQGYILESFQRLTRPSRKHNFQLVPRVPRDGVRGIKTNSFYFRSINTWNNLPKNVVDSPSVSSFKRNLEKAWNDHPLKYDIN